MIVFSIYLLLAGHNLPGGGFAGGLTAGLALTIRYLAGGRFELREATPVSAGALLGIGLATAAASGVAPLLLGGQVFQTAILEFWLPVFGDVKFVTSTIFDIGVYIVVVGLALDVLRSLGAEIDEHFEEHPSIRNRPKTRKPAKSRPKPQPRGKHERQPDPADGHGGTVCLRHLPDPGTQPHPGPAGPDDADQRHQPADPHHGRLRGPGAVVQQGHRSRASTTIRCRRP